MCPNATLSVHVICLFIYPVPRLEYVLSSCLVIKLVQLGFNKAVGFWTTSSTVVHFFSWKLGANNDPNA